MNEIVFDRVIGGYNCKAMAIAGYDDILYCAIGIVAALYCDYSRELELASYFITWPLGWETSVGLEPYPLQLTEGAGGGLNSPPAHCTEPPSILPTQAWLTFCGDDNRVLEKHNNRVASFFARLIYKNQFVF